jgi:hypothetical protein
VLKKFLSAQVIVMPPLNRDSPQWYTAEYPSLLTEFRRAFRAAPENLVLGNDFQVELSGDGVHMTSGSCSKLLDEALLRLPGVSLPPVTNEMAELRAESAATRELLLDLAERFRTHAASSNSVTTSAAEQLDAASNRTNECQIEIRGSYWLFLGFYIIQGRTSKFSYFRSTIWFKVYNVRILDKLLFCRFYFCYLFMF